MLGPGMAGEGKGGRADGATEVADELRRRRMDGVPFVFLQGPVVVEELAAQVALDGIRFRTEVGDPEWRLSAVVIIPGEG